MGSTQSAGGKAPVAPAAAIPLTATELQKQSEAIIAKTEAEIEKLEKDREIRENQAAECKENAMRSFANGDKAVYHYAAAVRGMRKSKLFEKDVEKIDGFIENLHVTIINIQTNVINQLAFQAMKVAEATLRRMKDELPIDKVESLMEQHRLVMEDHEEVEDVIVGAMNRGDESELLAELESFAGPRAVPREANEHLALPTVPSCELPSQDTANATPPTAAPTAV